MKAIRRAGENKKTQAKAPARTLTWANKNGQYNSTTLDADKARYLKGIQLYQSGAVEIGPDGMFYCNGYRVNPDNRISCECKDFQLRGRPCKHLYAVWQFQKHGIPRDSLLWFN